MEFGRIEPVDIKSDFRQGTFTGKVWGDSVVPTGEGTMVNHVAFEPSARTHWHSHPAGQLLIVTEGRGQVGSRDGSRRPIAEGDVIWTDPGEEHWHGADGDHSLSHVAVTLGETAWLEAVTDEQYAGS